MSIKGPAEIQPAVDKAWEILAIDPQSGCVLARTALESIVDLLSKRWGIVQKVNTPLYQKIEALKTFLSGPTCGYMHTIRFLGNEAAHTGAISKEGALVARAALVALMVEINKA
jgi:hypothetical protein